MKSRKKVKAAVVIAAAVTGVAGGSIAGVKYIRKNNTKAVEVTPVSQLNIGDLSMESDEGSYGTVVSNVTQNVQIPDGKVIEQVYVSEGDKVKIGDKLLSYDTTLLELDKELQEINLMELELEIKSAQADLAKLQNARPGDAIIDMSGGSLWDGELDADLDEGDDYEEARLMDNERSLLAVQNEPADGESEVLTRAETEVPETGASESAGESTEESESLSGVQTEYQTEPAQSEKKESEVILTPQEKETNEVLTPDDLNQANTETESEGETEEAEKKKKNQSLKPFFTNVRWKTVGEAEEVLLADIRPEEEAEVELSEKIKMIPHFRETEQAGFKKEHTYTMFLHGVELNETIKGNVYGTAQIDGEDYPEIGSFMLVQKKDSEDTAQLVIAFNDELEKQHEIQTVLADMYVELSLSKEELTGSEVRVSTGKDDDSAVFHLPEQEAEEAEISQISDLTENTDDTDDESETELIPDTESEPESESESESESEVIQEIDFVLQSATFQVNWDHGTNAEENWPSSLKLYVYRNGVENQDDPDCSFTLTQESSVAAGGDQGLDGTDSAIEEEVTTEPETEGTSEVPSEAETEMQTEEETAPAEAIPDEEGSAEQASWKEISVQMPEDLQIHAADMGMEKEEWSTRWAGYAPNYTMEVQDIQTDSSTSSVTVKIQMTYIKPADSPLLKLNPISELTWQHGINTLNETGMRAYKGSGTAEDPYVFFVTDGVKITNTFVNWVLGFNEEGTERIGDGYYIRLEIRESDAFTGAFIRSIDLDGTVLTETGYGPGTYWIFSSDTGITKYEEELPDDGGYPGGGADWGNDNDGMHYTAEQLAQAIEEKELELKKLKLDERQAQLKLKNYIKELDEATVTSAVDGYVKSINGSEDGAYMVVESENGLYVKTSVNELKLDSVAVDQIITCESYYTGERFTATITEISAFPSSEGDSSSYFYFGSSGNVNSSSYPVLAVVDASAEEQLSEYEDVSITYPSSSDIQKAGAIYLEKAYVRSENGQSYVYIADENNRLKKQYIRTGGIVWGYVEIKQGLSDEDQIAFPYGKAVKEGAAVKLTQEDE